MGGPFPPAGPPPRYYPRRRRGSIVWPVILIAVGLIFLLQNFGIISGEIWSSLWRLWPLILVLIGLELFVGGSSRGIVAVAIVALVGLAVAAVLAVSFFSGPILSRTAGPSTSRTLTQDLRGATSASVSVHFGAGTLNVGPLGDAKDQLAQLTYTGPERARPTSNYRVANGQGQLSYSISGAPGGSSSAMNLLLSPGVPLTLDVQEGASDGRIDLSQLNVANLSFQTGASHASLVLPQNAGLTTAVVKGGAANLDLEVPQGVAAQIHYSGGLSSLTVDQSRFPQAGDQLYKSNDYDSAQNKLDLTIEAGVSTINVH